LFGGSIDFRWNHRLEFPWVGSFKTTAL